MGARPSFVLNMLFGHTCADVQEVVKTEAATIGTAKRKPDFLDEADELQGDTEADFLAPQQNGAADDAGSETAGDRKKKKPELDADGYPTGRIPEDKKVGRLEDRLAQRLACIAR